jgi:hypothetical protein
LSILTGRRGAADRLRAGHPRDRNGKIAAGEVERTAGHRLRHRLAYGGVAGDERSGHPENAFLVLLRIAHEPAEKHLTGARNVDQQGGQGTTDARLGRDNAKAACARTLDELRCETGQGFHGRSRG